MSATLSNNAEGGVHGEDVTVYNSGAVSGDAFHEYRRDTGATIKFSNTHARGTMAYEFKTSATPARAEMTWSTFSGAPTVYVRCAFYLSADVVGKTVILINIKDTTNVCAAVVVTSSGKLRVRDATGAYMFESTTSVLYDTWQRLELETVSSAATGQATLRYFSEVDSPHPLETLASTATFNTRPAGMDITYAAFGVLSSGVANVTVYFDDLSFSSSQLAGPVDPHQSLPTILRANAENGSDGTAVTRLNSGDGYTHFFEEVTGTAIYSAEQSAHGALSYKLTPAPGAHTRVEWRSIATSSAALRLYIYFTGFPPAFTEFAHFTTNPFSGTFTNLARFAVNTDGRIHVFDTGGSIWNSSSPLALNTWYRLEMLATLGGTATTGTINAAYYALDNLTSIGNFSTASANLGSTPFGSLRVGKISNNAWTASMYIDDIAVQQNASVFIGLPTPPPVPVAYVGIIPSEGWGVPL